MSKFKLVLLFLSFAGLFASAQPVPQIKLQSGDILFREKSSENISEAIDQVTQTSGATHFSHVGLVEVTDAGIVVLHAYPEGGSCIVSLNEFLHPKGDSVRVIAYRLKNKGQKAIPAGDPESALDAGQTLQFQLYPIRHCPLLFGVCVSCFCCRFGF